MKHKHKHSSNNSSRVIKQTLPIFPWTLLWLVLLFVVPLCLASLLYFFRDNISFTIIPSGQLVTPSVPFESLGFVQTNAINEIKEKGKGKWQLVYSCQTKNKKECVAQHDLLTRIHLSLGKDQNRVFLSSSPLKSIKSPVNATLKSVEKIQENKVTIQQNSVFLIDPRGFLIMHYPLPIQNPKGMLEDIRRLLRFSHVG